MPERDLNRRYGDEGDEFIPGMALILRRIVRWYRGAHAYQRRFTLENAALAAATTVALTVSYGFLENAGWPRLSMFVVWPAMDTALAVTLILRTLLKR